VAYTPKQLALWDTLADLVRQHSPEDVLDAMSDAFIHFDEPGADIQRMERVGRALERVRSDLLGKEVVDAA
jgi:hypothetical protein